MIDMSIQYHDPLMCVCAYCTCGKHLCKVHPWKRPAISSSTMYQKEFTKKHPFNNLYFKPGA